jgi:hypothetical protein
MVAEGMRLEGVLRKCVCFFLVTRAWDWDWLGGPGHVFHNGLCLRHHQALAFVAIDAYGCRKGVALVAVGYDRYCPYRQSVLSMSK